MKSGLFEASATGAKLTKVGQATRFNRLMKVVLRAVVKRDFDCSYYHIGELYSTRTLCRCLPVKVSEKMFGELLPVGGGDPIPLLKKSLRVGRRESCDVVLRFPNVSSHHCLMNVDEGYWFIKDLHSRNGVKVNGARLVGESRKRLDPGDILTIAKHKYEISYSPVDLGAVGPPPQEERPEDFFGQSLMQRAGLVRRKKDREKPEEEKRFDVTDQSAGQLGNRDPNKPV